MPPQNTNQTENKLSPRTMLIIQFIFLLIVWATILMFPEFAKEKILVIPLTAVATIYCIFMLIRYLINSKKFIEQQEQKEKRLEKSFLGRVSLTLSRSWTVDIQIFRIIFKKFQLFIPFLISVVVIFIIVWILLSSGFDRGFLNILVKNNVSLYLTFPLLFLVNSFFGCCIFVLGYITLGYILRKKYLNIQESFFVIVLRFFKLFGYVLILSVVWVLMLLIFSSKRKNALIGVIQIATLGILSAFKLFLYLNIVRVSLGDEKSSFKETYEFAKKDIYKLLRVWFGSGLILASIFFVGLFSLVVLNHFGIIESSSANSAIIAPIFFGFLILIFVFRAFAEQIGLFGIYLKDRYNIDIFNN